MSYRLEATRRFEKDLRRLPTDLKRRIDTGVRMLENNPGIGKRLRGELEGTMSLRIGDYRVLYAVQESGRLVVLLTVAHRSGVYD
jgi:mRNA interferase RelE/StbE